MVDSFPNNFDEIKQIPRESLIDLLKSDLVTDFLLDWASQQRDREIALAILMNPKTSQQHLEKLFQTCDNYLLELDNISKYDDFCFPENEVKRNNWYQSIKLTWNLIYNIEAHINWEEKTLEFDWENNIINDILNIRYQEQGSVYHNSSLFIPLDKSSIFIKTMNLDCSSLIELALQNCNYSKTYKNFLYRLRKLHVIPRKQTKSKIDRIEIIQAKEVKESLNRKKCDFIGIDELKKIAFSSNYGKILTEVIYHPKINIEILNILSESDDWEIRYRVAIHNKASINILEKLSLDKEERVRSNVAKNSMTPISILKNLAKDKNRKVRCSILNNPSLTKDLFYKLMYDINSQTDYSFSRLVAFLDPNVSPKILEQNASSLLWNERFAIAIHPKTPSRTVEKLTKDGNVYVREIAHQRKRNHG